VAMGFCLYTFVSATLLWPILGLVLLGCLLRRPGWGQVLAIAVMVVGFVLVITPGLITNPPTEMLAMINQNSRREVAAVDPIGLAQGNIFHSFLAWWSNLQWHFRYIGGSLVDPVGGLLLAIGIGVALFGLKRRSSVVALAWYGLGFCIVGVTHYVIQAPHTRLLFVMPAVALLIGLGAQAVYGILNQSLRLPRSVGLAVVAAFVLALPPLNLYQLLVDSPQYVRASASDLFIKAFEEFPNKTIVEVAPEHDGSMDVLMLAAPWYANRYRYAGFNDIDRMRSELGDGAVFVVDEVAYKTLVDDVDTKLGTSYDRLRRYDAAHMNWVAYFVPKARSLDK